MKKPYLLSMLLIVFLLMFSFCKKVDVPKDTPDCIKDKIKQIQKEEVRNPSAKVYKCVYDGQTVYYFPPYCCDIPGELYDTDCNLICQPDGGLTGDGDGTCTDFFDERTDVELIWEDDR